MALAAIAVAKCVSMVEVSSLGILEFERERDCFMQNLPLLVFCMMEKTEFWLIKLLLRVLKVTQHYVYSVLQPAKSMNIVQRRLLLLFSAGIFVGHKVRFLHTCVCVSWLWRWWWGNEREGGGLLSYHVARSKGVEKVSCHFF